MPGPQPYANALFRFTPLFTPHPSKISLAKSPFPRYNTLKVKGSKGRAPCRAPYRFVTTGGLPPRGIL